MAPAPEDALSEDAILYKALKTRGPMIFGPNEYWRLAKTVAENDDVIPSMGYLLEFYHADRKRRASNGAAAGAPQAKKSVPAKDSSSADSSGVETTMKGTNRKAKVANIGAVSKVHGRTHNQTSRCTQTEEGLLSATMMKYGMNLGEDLNKPDKFAVRMRHVSCQPHPGHVFSMPVLENLTMEIKCSPSDVAQTPRVPSPVPPSPPPVSLTASRPASSSSPSKQGERIEEGSKKRRRGKKVGRAVKRQLLAASKKLIDDKHPLAKRMSSLDTFEYIMSQVPEYPHGAMTLKAFLLLHKKKTGSWYSWY